MRMTFVISNPNLSGGVRAIAIYAERLGQRGHDVTVVSRPRPTPPLRRKVKSLLTGSGWPGRPNGRTHLDNLSVRHHQIDGWRAMTDDDIPDGDVVIASWWETAEWVHGLSPSKGAKVYFVQHHEIVFANQPVERVRATYRLPGMQKICSARWLQDLMRDEYGDRDALHVPYGVDHELFNAPPRGRQQRPTVGVMYTKAHFKGCDISLKAFEIASRTVAGLRLKAFGTIDPDESLPLPTGRCDYAKQPPQTTIRDIYSTCDAWLFASRCEGFGLPVLEAMACRTPVIATPTGAGPEAVADGGGILIGHEDPEQMADAIVRICTMDDERWRAMSQTAYETAQRYDWDTSTRQFESALAQAIGSERRLAATAS